MHTLGLRNKPCVSTFGPNTITTIETSIHRSDLIDVVMQSLNESGFSERDNSILYVFTTD